MSVLKFFTNPKKSSFKKSFQRTFGFKANNIEIFEQAFLHRSLNQSQDSNNERLEFLGDSVLSLVVSDLFYYYFQNESEGFLSNMRSKVANRQFLNEISLKMGVDKFVRYDKNIRLDDRPLTDLFGNALEAFIGAIYVDKGYYFTKKFVINNIIHKYVDIDQIQYLELNYKGKLNELAQKKNLEIKFIIEEQKVKHDIIYLAKVMINGEILGSGSGHKKKQAEQEAAEMAYKSIVS